MWDFIKGAIVEKVEDVPEQFRFLYAQDEATKKFVIAPGAKAIVDAYVGTATSEAKLRKDLATSNAESASRRVTAASVVDFAKKLGLENIDEANPLTTLEGHYNDLVGKIKGGSDLKVNLENIKKDYEAKNKQVVDQSDAKNSKMLKSLEQHMIGNASLVAFAKHGGNATFLTDIVAKRAKVVQEGEDFVVRILDDAGSPRSNGAGGWLDIDSYVGELKSNTTYAAAFASEQKGGTGHQPGSSKQQPMPKQGAEKSSVDKIAAGLKKGNYARGAAAA